MNDSGFKRPERIADSVACYLEELILEGSLRPGEMLPAERELSLRLDVSRPTLRIALKELAERGLLNRAGKGMEIAQIGSLSITDPLIAMMERDDIADHYLEFRDVVESSAAALAAQRANEPDLARIKQCMARIEAAHQAQDVDEEDAADAELHIAIYEASHNLVLLQIMRALIDNLRADVSYNRRRLFVVTEARELLRDQHLGIVSAIIERRPDAARLAAHEHLAYLRRVTKEIREAESRLEISLRRLDKGGLGGARADNQ